MSSPSGSADRPGCRHPCCGRRRRSGGGRGRQRHCGDRRSVQHGGHQRRRVCICGHTRRRPAATHAHVLPCRAGQVACDGRGPSAGGSLRWLRDTFFQPEGVVARTLGTDPYELMAQGAAQIAPGAEGLIFPAVSHRRAHSVPGCQCAGRLFRHDPAAHAGAFQPAPCWKGSHMRSTTRSRSSRELGVPVPKCGHRAAGPSLPCGVRSMPM